MKARLSSLISRANTERCGSRHYPVLSMTMHDGLVLQSDRFKKEIASKNKSQYKVVRRGQLVVGFPIDEGVLATQEVTDRGIVSPAYDIWDIEQSLVLPKYLELSLRSEKAIEYYRAKLKGTTARRRSIRKDDFLSMSINVPGIDQQRFALDRMKAVDGLLSGCRFQLDKLDDLVKSRFTEMFGDPGLNSENYPIVRLSEIAEYHGGLTYSPSDVAEEGVIVLRFNNIQNGRIDLSDVVKVTCPIREKYYVRSKDILICSRNGSARLVGKAALIDKASTPMAFGAFMMIIRSSYYPYLLPLLSMRAFRSQLSFGTATINQITSRMLNSVRIPCPPTELVNEFEGFVTKVDKLRFDVQQQIEKLETLKKSLMQEYFG